MALACLNVEGIGEDYPSFVLYHGNRPLTIQPFVQLFAVYELATWSAAKGVGLRVPKLPNGVGIFFGGEPHLHKCANFSLWPRGSGPPRMKDESRMSPR